MRLSISDRQAVVAGCGSDLGKACATRLEAEVAGLARIEHLSREDVEGAPQADIVVAVLPKFAPGSLLSLTDGLLDEAWQCVPATVALFQQMLPYMKARSWGRLIVVGSTDAKVWAGVERDTARAVSLALLGLQKAISGEFGPYGLTCNSVLCDLHGKERGDIDQYKVIENAAAAVTYLASSRSAFMTGIVISVDGGRSSSVF